jgi:hypothetical protein
MWIKAWAFGAICSQGIELMPGRIAGQIALSWDEFVPAFRPHRLQVRGSMRDNPFHSLYQVLTGQIHDQLALGANGWLTVVLAWLLFCGGIAIAVYLLAVDPTQRTAKHISVFAMRFIAAGMWYLGTLWKLPWPVAHGFKDWLTNCVTYSSFQFHADIMQFFLVHIALVQPLVYLLELFFAFSLACGFAVRFTGVVAALFVVNLLFGLYNDPTEWVWTYVGIAAAHGMFAADGAGQSLGLDRVLRLKPILPAGSPVGQIYALAS